LFFVLGKTGFFIFGPGCSDLSMNPSMAAADASPANIDESVNWQVDVKEFHTKPVQSESAKQKLPHSIWDLKSWFYLIQGENNYTIWLIYGRNKNFMDFQFQFNVT